MISIENKNYKACPHCYTKRCRRGFTLLELLLVIALLLAIGVPAAVFSTRFIYQMAVRDAAEGLTGMIREAQALAISGKQHSSWGVKYGSDKLTLFSGDSYSSRNQSLDQILAINPNVNMSGFSEIVFAYPQGFPDQEFSITVSHGNISESFSVNREGTVE